MSRVTNARVQALPLVEIVFHSSWLHDTTGYYPGKIALVPMTLQRASCRTLDLVSQTRPFLFYSTDCFHCVLILKAIDAVGWKGSGL